MKNRMAWGVAVALAMLLPGSVGVVVQHAYRPQVVYFNFKSGPSLGWGCGKAAAVRHITLGRIVVIWYR